ncbi:FHA domain-containing protein [Schumannella sp. 10F1B-5-1]|uniref:FHA domain-containing protein n=1 Tax=Schumannella sp. 10F1B-5-1 TaxID=2590780 RepID=UPI0011319838|nr:FHA domain-containing protein [Schumannella sp. 10F1B-5-1]TPW72249.1 FHA domain-containing protein [Schumannella sp. 10F1B-5-1]
MTIYSVTPGAPGEWAALAADRLLLVVKADAQLEPAALLGELAGAEPARRVIEALTSRGLAATPSFALIEHPATSGPVRVIVRGEITVAGSGAAGAVELSGTGVATWAERLVDGLADVIVSTSGEATGTALPLGHGAVWASGVAVVDAATSPIAAAAAHVELESSIAGPGAPVAPSAPAGIGAPPVAAPTAGFVAAAPVAAVAAADLAAEGAGAVGAVPIAEGDAEVEAEPLEADAEAEPAAEDGAASDVASEQTIVDLPDELATILPPSDDEGAASDAAESGAADDEPGTIADGSLAGVPEAPAEASEYDHLFEATIVRPIEDAAVRPPEEGEEEAAAAPVLPGAAPAPVAPSASTAPEDDGDHDGMTVLSGDLAGFGDRQRPAEHEIAAAPAGPEFWLVLPGGAREQLTHETLVGRAPAGKVTGGELPRLVTLAGDPDISRTHVRFLLEGDTVVVTDLNSRNGTSVVLPGKPPQLLRGGEPVAVIAGTVVDLGGGSAITVEQVG